MDYMVAINDMGENVVYDDEIHLEKNIQQSNKELGFDDWKFIIIYTCFVIIVEMIGNIVICVVLLILKVKCICSVGIYNFKVWSASFVDVLVIWYLVVITIYN